MRRRAGQFAVFIILVFAACLVSCVSFSEEANVSVSFNKNVAVSGDALTATWIFGKEYEPIQYQEVEIYSWKDANSL